MHKAKINYDYYNGKDLYSDGLIEKKIYMKYKNNNSFTNEINDDMFYLTSKIRENIISWYPFKQDSNVLEIGAGTGTIVGKLCELCKHVTVVEGSKKRSEIIYERHKTKDNLEIMVGNFNDIIFNKKFDYILLIGVFEYSKIFFDEKNPFESFLSKIKKLLKVNGKIIIAIENRYGIKYWAGNKEDHLGKPYVGLIGYDNSKVQTFGKNELITLLEKCGLKNNKFYSCFPDYKMPQLIFSDTYYPDKGELCSIPIYNYGFEKYSFDPKKVLHGLSENKLLHYFSNSYLIETSPYDCELSNINYVKFQAFRNEEYNTFTMINENNEVIKKSNTKEALNHLKNIELISNDLKKYNIPINNVEYINNYLLIEKIKGNSVEELLLKNSNNKKEFLKIFNDYIEFAKSLCISKTINKPLIKEQLDIYKNKKTLVLKLGLLDFNLSNTFIYKENYTLIDQEWSIDKDIPLDYIIYFSIKLIFEKNDESIGIIKKDEILKKYNITKSKQDCFDKMSKYYFNENKKVNDINTFKKIKEHSKIIIDEEINNMKNEITFYKQLLDKQREGYEQEIDRITNSLLQENREKIEMIQENYEKEIKRLHNIEIKYDKLIHKKIIKMLLKFMR